MTDERRLRVQGFGFEIYTRVGPYGRDYVGELWSGELKWRETKPLASWREAVFEMRQARDNIRRKDREKTARDKRRSNAVIKDIRKAK